NEKVDREHMTSQSQPRAESVLSSPRILTDEELRVAQLDRVVADVDVDPVPRLPLDDDRVVPRVLEVDAEETVRLRRGGAVGSGADRYDGEAARDTGGQPGHGPGGEDQQVVPAVPAPVATA